MSCFTMTSLHAGLPTARPFRALTCRPLTVPCFQGFGRVGRLGLAQFEGRSIRHAQDLSLVSVSIVVKVCRLWAESAELATKWQ